MINSELVRKINIAEDEPFWWATGRPLDLYEEFPNELADIKRAIELEKEGFQVADVGADEETLGVIVPGVGILCQRDIQAHISKRGIRANKFYKQLARAWEYSALSYQYET